MTPKIAGPEGHDFHDSSLIDIVVGPHLDKIKVIVSTPDETLGQKLWLIEFGGVLRLEYETLGAGTEETRDIPLEIYDIYNDETSEERSRWIQRLRVLGVNARDANNLFHIVLASSFIRGWGKTIISKVSILSVELLTFDQLRKTTKGWNTRVPQLKPATNKGSRRA